ncbi:uncharacterized protein LOC126784727 [Argentina anserina]|uniref:uncharacterized protein LOC126784727 n=1 Tax=Argentina anserina TaxID=57926 RepID=UPI0021765C07|nr:uncharacterized protein LOC126784727 [Potentilla anserina]
MLRLRPISDLDPDDPRRWTKPKSNLERHCWEEGFVSIELAEFIRYQRKKFGRRQVYRPSEAEQKKNYGRWLPSLITASCIDDEPAPSKRKAIDFGVAPTAPPKKRAMGVPSAGSAFKDCNSCGVTHWRQQCPYRVPRGAPEESTEPKSAVGTDNTSPQT